MPKAGRTNKMAQENKHTSKTEIANTIINQMGGGGKLRAMIGAKDIYALDAGVQFAFKLCKKMNKCVVDLNQDDLYNVKFYKIPHLNPNCTPAALDRYFKNVDKATTPVAEFENIYADQLNSVFESETGLYLSL